VFAIDLARVTAAGFLATTLGTSVFKTESLDIRGILGTIATLMTPMDQPTAFLVGTGWHCLNEIAFAAIYARILIAVRKQSTVITGVLAWPCAMSSPHAHSADSIQRGSAGSIRSTAKSRDVPFTYRYGMDAGAFRFAGSFGLWTPRGCDLLPSRRPWKHTNRESES